MAMFGVLIVGVMFYVMLVTIIMGWSCLIISLILLLKKSKKEKLNQKRSKVKTIIGVVLLIIGLGNLITIGLFNLSGFFLAP